MDFVLFLFVIIKENLSCVTNLSERLQEFDKNLGLL